MVAVNCTVGQPSMIIDCYTISNEYIGNNYNKWDPNTSIDTEYKPGNKTSTSQSGMIQA